MNYGIFRDENIYEADGYSLKENVSLSDYLKHCKNWGESGQGWKYEDKIMDAIDAARDFAEGSKAGVSVVSMDTYKELVSFEAGVQDGAKKIEESIYLMCEELAGKEDFENNIFSVHFQETEDFEEYYRVYAECGYIVDVSCEVIEKDGKEEKKFFVLDFHSEDEHSILVDKNKLYNILSEV